MKNNIRVERAIKNITQANDQQSSHGIHFRRCILSKKTNNERGEE